MTDLRLGDGCVVDDTVDVPSSSDGAPPRVGDGATIRSGTIIYPDVVVGDGLQTGHHVVVREQTVVGDDVVLGTKTVLDGRCDVGDEASLQTGVYVPPYSEVGDRVFLGPNAVLTNDPYPLREDCDLVGPTLENDVSVGANATILPGVTVGERSFVAAGSVVTEDVPPETLAIGVPAEHRSLPAELDASNVQ
jgi:acetyltransferase-like isoleucine patch superfamily enzyme